MANPTKKQIKTEKGAASPVTSISEQKTLKKPFAFEKANYQIMLLGILLIIIGFVIMASDNEPYGFGFLGLTLGPIVLFLGFIVQFVAIFYKPKKS